MKKTIKLLVIIDFCLFISFTLGGIILEILELFHSLKELLLMLCGIYFLLEHT